MKRVIIRVGFILEMEDSVTTKELIQTVNNAGHTYWGNPNILSTQIREIMIPDISEVPEGGIGPEETIKH